MTSTQGLYLKGSRLNTMPNCKLQIQKKLVDRLWWVLVKHNYYAVKRSLPCFHARQPLKLHRCLTLNVSWVGSGSVLPKPRKDYRQASFLVAQHKYQRAKSTYNTVYDTPKALDSGASGTAGSNPSLQIF